MAALRGADGTPYSFSRRLDRLRLRAPGERADVAATGAAATDAAAASEPVPPGDDDFGFDDVLRLTGATLAGAAPAAGTAGAGRAAVEGADGSPDGAASGEAGTGVVVDVRSALERAALGLAFADETTIAVRDTRVERPVVGGATGCALEQVLREGQGSALRFVAERCPSGARIGGLALATSATLDVRGTLEIDGEARAVEGRGWTRRVWGEPPVPGGAVVFDRLLLELDGVGLVEAERSKRRSGRGPRTVGARLRGVEVDEELALEWLDAVHRDDAVPPAWTLRSEVLGLEVTLVPLAGGAIARDATGTSWRGAVRAGGSHAGTGFIEIALPEAAATEEAVRETNVCWTGGRHASPAMGGDAIGAPPGVRPRGRAGAGRVRG